MLPTPFADRTTMSLPQVHRGGKNQLHPHKGVTPNPCSISFPSPRHPYIHVPGLTFLPLDYNNSESSIVWLPDKINMMPGYDQLVLDGTITHSFFYSFTKHVISVYYASANLPDS